MKNQLIAMSVMSLFAGSALAQSAFSGFYGQVSTGYESNSLGSLSGGSTEIPNNKSDTIGLSSSQTFGGAPLVFGVGYYWQASDKWLIGVGADYSALSQTSSSISGPVTNAPGNTLLAAGATVTGNNASLKLSDRFNIFITPAYAIDKDKLVYLKAGYSQVASQFSRHTSATRTFNGVSTTTPATAGTLSSNEGGYLIGLGYKQIITKGLYGFVEGNYMAYSAPSYSATATVNATNNLHNVTTTGTRTQYYNFASLNSYQLLVGLGYAF
jgi:hypothetical protein